MTEIRKQPTMADIARLAGVSAMTVSRALRPDSSISDTTRQRIVEIADQLGYVMDSTAAGLSSGRTGFIATTIPSINNSNFADTVRGLTEGLADTGLQILLGYTDYDPAKEEQLVEQFLRRRPEAVVVSGGSHTDRCRRLLERADIPVIETWDLPKDPIGDVVGFSNRRASKLMVEHFVAQGFERIAFIGGDTSRDTRGLDRRRGFIEAAEEMGLAADRVLASGIPPITMHDGAKAIGHLLEKWPDTQAVMCVSDLSAFGALNACLRKGLKLPDELAIAGFGAYDLAEYSIPTLTTIDVSAYDIGRRTAAGIVELLRGNGDMASPILVEPKLIARESTKVARNG